MQFCKQVQDALNGAFAADAGSPVLRGLYAAHVEPAPDSSRVRVHIAGEAIRDLGLDRVLNELARARPFLRLMIGEAIARKRVPELVFAPAAAEEVRDE